MTTLHESKCSTGRQPCSQGLANVAVRRSFALRALQWPSATLAFMRLPGPLAVCILLLCAPFGAALGQQPTAADVAARIAAQNELFEEQYQTDLKLSPQMATAYGDYRYNDQLDDDSLAGNVRQHSADEAYLARLKAISTAGFPDQIGRAHV